MSNREGIYIWYELLTTDVDAAARFYGGVLGVQAVPVGPDPGAYRRFEIGGEGIGGLARQVQGGPPPVWLGYVGVSDVDAAVARIRAEGGGVHVPPTDIPGVGRFAMVNDPQGAVFYVMRGASEENSTAFGPGRSGHGEWHELHTSDVAAAGAFYSRVFGWTLTEPFDMGAMGVYQTFAAGSGDALGGIMRDAGSPRPFWLYYMNVARIGPAIERIGSHGGRLVLGPHQVPGGNWIVVAHDPQGAMFALTAREA